MNLEKFTQKSKEALLAAQGSARQYQHQTVEPIHPLLALVQQPDGMVPAPITRVSGGTQALEQELVKELANRPKIRGANLDVGLARPTSEALSAGSKGDEASTPKGREKK